MKEYLEPTELVNCDDLRIRRKAAELAPPEMPAAERLQALATFTREWIRFQVGSRAPLARASQVLCFLEGSAAEKAVLFAALCRASGFPCRIKFQRLAGAPDRWTALGRLAKAEWKEAHPVNEVLLEERWLTIDVSLDSETASRLGLLMPAFSGRSAATLAESVAWVPDALIRVEVEPQPDEGLPAELLRLVQTVPE
jgi:transglutaminase-like putative cysteine protease